MNTHQNILDLEQGIGTNMDFLQIEAEVENIATITGLNNWELQQAHYNGCSFSVIIPVSGGSSVIGQAVANGAYAYQKTLGKQKKITDPNQYGGLLNTSLNITGIKDKLKAKYVKKRLPYSNSDSIEFMGYSGWSFNLTAVFIGFDYLTGFNNFLNSIHNPPSIDVENVFIHPIYGQIAGKTLLVDINPIYQSDQRQAVGLELFFEAEESLAFKDAGHGALAIAGAALNALLQTIGAVTAAISIGKSVIK